ncbi:glycoside hydrolase family 3 N-terminal domain-containing protein [Flammeovirga sp. SJP92]|uniref:glycoside hydrolase family 3 N-terminal domain-containing protein n=1 Tax=Flammeovirga sp. SJP92 TaxID=1775430 RepID=UPI0007C82263|nr:glycoside hydrolase family 3 N-terminal domain-containing protein [Flammeovirga sp. SJP92]
MRNLILCLSLFFISAGVTDKKPDYKKANLPIETRVKDLVSRMTLEEKIQQLDMYSGGDLTKEGILEVKKVKQMLGDKSVGSIHDYYPENAALSNEVQKYFVEETRLGIPVLFIEEALHGYQGKKSTAFPVPIGMGSMWDVELMEKIGHAVGRETRSVGVHMVLSPVLGIGREPRWGRVQETYGEDPYLAARNGVAIIKGMQGDDLTKDDAIVAEPKHFGVHSIPEGGSNTSPVYIGEREARTNFLYVFEKAFKEAEALGAMAAYHEWDGIPAAADEWLLKDLLRDEWGFKGMVISDLGAIAKQQNSHFTAATPKDAIANSIRAGLDMQFYDYSHEVFETSVKEALEEKTLSMEDIDRAVSSVLYVKFRLGLFENPYIDPSLKEQRYHTQEHQELALESAHKSIVLLQNNEQILPFSDNIKKVAVLGKMADEVNLGGYSPKEVEGVSIVEAFQNTNYDVTYVNPKLPANAFEHIDPEVLVSMDNKQGGLTRQFFNTPDLTGEAVVTEVTSELIRNWHNLSPAAGVSASNYSTKYEGYIVPKYSGDYTFALVADDLGRMYFGDELFIDCWNEESWNVTRTRTIRLEKGEQYKIRIEHAGLEGSNGIGLRWQVKPDLEVSRFSMYEEAVEVASESDVAVIVVGESLEESGEGLDKVSLRLSTYHKGLIDAVHETGTPIVLVLQNGRPMVLTEEVNQATAILETWYAGELSGQGTVDILTGKVNPSAKLPITFPRSEGQLPLYYNHKRSSSHHYVDEASTPLFAFGHGLNYSSFEYKDLSLAKTQIAKDENLSVSVKVKNTSAVDGTEIAQLYIQDVVSSVATPIMQLRGFERIYLKAGEEKTIEFILTPDDLSLWNRQMKRVVEEGTFKVMIGAASDDIRLETSFEVK